MTDNPVVALNRVVAAAMVHGPRTALEWLAEIEADPRLARSHRVLAVRAHLLERAGERERAAERYRAAAAATPSTAERHYLMSRAARLRSDEP
jgi:predicted RNA polymerase sigma factor